MTNTPVPALFIQALAGQRWADAHQLLDKHATMRWPVSGEQFIGRDSIIAVHQHNPDDWQVEILEDNDLGTTRRHMLQRVQHGQDSFFANVFYLIEQHKIMNIDEYWAVVEPPSRWRKQLPGWQPLYPTEHVSQTGHLLSGRALRASSFTADNLIDDRYHTPALRRFMAKGNDIQ